MRSPPMSAGRVTTTNQPQVFRSWPHHRRPGPFLDDHDRCMATVFLDYVVPMHNPAEIDFKIDPLALAEDLGLRLVTAGHVREINWTATTELSDPTPFLQGGELVLTTGMSIDADQPDQIREYVARLSTAGINWLGLGTGLGHDDVPPALITACAENGTGLLDVPYEIPFIAISRYIADRVNQQRNREIRLNLDVVERLGQSLLHPDPIGQFVDVLAERTDQAWLVLDFYGRTLAVSDRISTWPIEAIVTRRTQKERWSLGDLVIYPIIIGNATAAMLCTRGSGSHTWLDGALTLLTVAIDRQESIAGARRREAGSVLSDLIERRLTDQQLQRRLSSFGLDVAARHAVVIARPLRRESTLANLPWNVQGELDRNGSGGVVAMVDRSMVIVVPESYDLSRIARQAFDRVRQFVPESAVGGSGFHTGIAGIRLGYREALSNLGPKPGVYFGRRPRMSQMLLSLASPDPELAEHALGPLTRPENRELLETIDAHLSNAGSLTETASALFIHRNTLRNRLRRIETLTGLSLDRSADVAELWIALELWAAHGPAPSGTKG